MNLYHHKDTHIMEWSPDKHRGPRWRNVTTIWFNELPRPFLDIHEEIWWFENAIEINGRIIGPYLREIINE